MYRVNKPENHLRLRKAARAAVVIEMARSIRGNGELPVLGELFVRRYVVVFLLVDFVGEVISLLDIVVSSVVSVRDSHSVVTFVI